MMVRCDYTSTNRRDYICLSTDTKITEGIGDGSTCLEVDTGILFIFYKDRWYAQN